MRNLFAAVLVLALCSCAGATVRPPEDLGSMKVSEHGADLRWNLSKFPIRVVTSPDLPALAVERLDAMTAELNRKIGTVVFSRAEVADPAEQVRVEVADMRPRVGTVYVLQAQYWNGHERTADTVTYYEIDGEITAARVRLPDDPGEEPGANFSDHLLRHELGHVLGLDHDGQGASVMSPEVEEGQRFTARDLALLRRLYRAL